MLICDECFGDGYVCDESDPGRAIAKECPKCHGTGENKDLKSCPFCGSAAERIDIDATDEFEPNAGGSYIACPNCYTSSKVVFGDKSGLEEAWNLRVAVAEINFDVIDDAFDKFLEGFNDVEGERYERRAARNGGEWMKHLIRQAMKTPNTDFNLTQPAASQVKS
jgi:RecJ-like exonuclease